MSIDRQSRCCCFCLHEFKPTIPFTVELVNRIIGPTASGITGYCTFLKSQLYNFPTFAVFLWKIIISHLLFDHSNSDVNRSETDVKDHCLDASKRMAFLFNYRVLPDFHYVHVLGEFKTVASQQQNKAMELQHAEVQHNNKIIKAY